MNKLATAATAALTAALNKDRQQLGPDAPEEEDGFGQVLVELKRAKP